MQNNHIISGVRRNYISNPALPGLVLIVSAMILSSCVNDGANSTLASAKSDTAASTHEEKHVAKKCTSSDRLRSSNSASNALTAALTAYSEKEATLSEAARTKLTSGFQEHAATLQQLDQDLNAQCRSYSACEFKSGSTKQDCTSEKHKFLDSEKAMQKFAGQMTKLKV